MTIHKQSLDLWSKTSRQVAEELDARFPRSDWTSTYAGHGENGAGWSIDLMCSRAIGDKIAEYAWANRERLGIWYIIWNRRIISQTRPGAGWQPYWDGWNSNPSKAHTNHVHISIYPGRVYSPPGGSKPVAPKDQKLVTRYAKANGTKGYYSKKNPSPVKHTRKKGFKIRGYWVNRKKANGTSDGKYLRTLYGTDYPQSSLTATKPKTATTHTVKKGETLTSIAKKYDTTVAALVKANKIRHPNVISVGQKLKVK